MYIEPNKKLPPKEIKNRNKEASCLIRKMVSQLEKAYKATQGSTLIFA